MNYITYHLSEAVDNMKVPKTFVFIKAIFQENFRRCFAAVYQFDNCFIIFIIQDVLYHLQHWGNACSCSQHGDCFVLRKKNEQLLRLIKSEIKESVMLKISMVSVAILKSSKIAIHKSFPHI